MTWPAALKKTCRHPLGCFEFSPDPRSLRAAERLAKSIHARALKVGSSRSKRTNSVDSLAVKASIRSMDDVVAWFLAQRFRRPS